MKLSTFATLSAAALAVAAPADSTYDASPASLEKRQGCTYGFVFARGSTEPSPIGILIGPKLQSALRAKLPGLKTYPVLYAASLATNVSPQRTDAKSISKGMQAFSQAKGCRAIVAGGYSQGAAVMHNVVSKLDAATKAKVKGVALFGDTRNKQDRGHIPNFPTERSRVWCKKNDGVCGGALNVNAGHMSYNGADISQAATYLAGLAKGGR